MADLVEEVAASQLALENGRDRGMEVPFRLAPNVGRQEQASRLVQRYPLKVAQDLEGASRDRGRAERGVRALGADHTTGGRRVGVAFRADLGAALDARRELWPVAHRLE